MDTASAACENKKRAWVLYLASFWIVLSSLLQPLGVQGVASLATVGLLAISLVPKRRIAERPRHGVRFPAVLAFFWGYASISTVVSQNTAGAQNLLVYSVFFMSILAASSLQNPTKIARIWWGRFVRLSLFSAFLYLCTVAIAGPNANLLYSSRPHAMMMLVGVCFSVPLSNMQFSEGVSLIKRVAPTSVLVATSALTLSRTATAASYSLAGALAFKKSSTSSIVKFLMIFAVLGCGAWFAFTRFSSFQERFATNDQVEIFGLQIGTTGRAVIWDVVIHSWRAGDVVFGNGAGSSQTTVTSFFGERIGHPHNEYLRVLHDYGLLGALPLFIGMIFLFRRSYLGWREAKESPTSRMIHQAALMAILGVAILSVTSNVTVYIFVMMPMGLLIGLSQATLRWDRNSQSESMAIRSVIAR